MRHMALERKDTHRIILLPERGRADSRAGWLEESGLRALAIPDWLRGLRRLHGLLWLTVAGGG